MRITPLGRLCSCEDVPAADLVACCPDCGTPLAQSKYDPAYGFCPLNTEGGRCFYDRNMVPPDDFLWKHRDLYDGADLPPANGWRPIDVDASLAWLRARTENQ